MHWRLHPISSGAAPRRLRRKELLVCTPPDVDPGASRFRFWIWCSFGAVYVLVCSNTNPYSERRGETVRQSPLHFTIPTLRISQPLDIPGFAIGSHPVELCRGR